MKNSAPDLPDRDPILAEGEHPNGEKSRQCWRIGVRGAEKVIGGSNNLRKMKKRTNFGEIYSMEFIREVEFVGRDVVVEVVVVAS